eukprot:5818161-Ditylum_brightwellii.AAC.1
MRHNTKEDYKLWKLLLKKVSKEKFMNNIVEGHQTKIYIFDFCLMGLNSMSIHGRARRLYIPRKLQGKVSNNSAEENEEGGLYPDTIGQFKCNMMDIQTFVHMDSASKEPGMSSLTIPKLFRISPQPQKIIDLIKSLLQ